MPKTHYSIAPRQNATKLRPEAAGRGARPFEKQKALERFEGLVTSTR